MRLGMTSPGLVIIAYARVWEKRNVKLLLNGSLPKQPWKVIGVVPPGPRQERQQRSKVLTPAAGTADIPPEEMAVTIGVQ